jgi:3-hydroxyisobutyrate dehydrogenase
MNILFIGLGHMGFPMASNLLKKGFHVVGMDIAKAACELFESIGGQTLTALDKTTCQSIDVVITMLQKGDQVKQVYLGEKGLFQCLRPNTTMIDCSTIDVETAKLIHQTASEHLIQSLDAPVSGGVSGASMGQLTFMVGGEKVVMEAMLPIFNAMGKQILFVGGAGMGQAAKICNNMLLGISMIGVSEAFLLADKLGLSKERLHDVLSVSSGNCWVVERYVPVPDILPSAPASKGYQPGFTGAMMLKDLTLSQDIAIKLGLDTKMGHLAMDLYQAYVDKGQGGMDFSGVLMLNESR